MTETMSRPRSAEVSTAAPAEHAWVVVAFRGELDFASARVLNVLEEAVRRSPGTRILVDLSEVSFLDSAALRVFDRARVQAASTGGLLTVHGASPFASRLLEMYGLDPH